MLTEYYDAVHTETIKFRARACPTPISNRIVDDNWDPPVSLGSCAW